MNGNGDGDQELFCYSHQVEWLKLQEEVKENNVEEERGEGGMGEKNKNDAIANGCIRAAAGNRNDDREYLFKTSIMIDYERRRSLLLNQRFLEVVEGVDGKGICFRIVRNEKRLFVEHESTMTRGATKKGIRKFRKTGRFKFTSTLNK